MLTLGIETSCDETSAAVVDDGRNILSNITVSSLAQHKKHGGIIPEIAFRKHIECITGVCEQAVRTAGIGLDKIGLIGVTDGPGLLGSLVVGISFAKTISYTLGLPLVGVNHLDAHIYANCLAKNPPKPPFVALVISGGHTSLFRVTRFDKTALIGSTQDDACGEAFDKVAKLLGLGYPGGPLIEKHAQAADELKAIKFSCANPGSPLDFSFSGIKTAVMYHIRKNPKLSKKEIYRICSSFQESVVDTLIEKSAAACKEMRSNTLVIGGGVAANNRLREQFFRKLEDERGIKCYFPSKQLCIDNAAMVAGLGYELYKSGSRSGIELNVSLN